MTDPIDLDQIRADAEAADQGDWFYDSEGDIWDGKAMGVLIANCDLTENATHIANMDPPTTQRLIARLDQAEEEVAELDSMEQETLKAKARRLEAKLQRAEAALREIAQSHAFEWHPSCFHWRDKARAALAIEETSPMPAEPAPERRRTDE